MNFTEKMLTVWCVPDGELEPCWRGKVHRRVVWIQHVRENYREVELELYPIAALRTQFVMSRQTNPSECRPLVFLYHTDVPMYIFSTL
mmetsp:Transcript_424/g.3200  ORF Transcript_424/g.3200 Transcript_424/m.3200 type:complete len:88 (-) Transcript_424:980-1243(-)